MGIVDLASQDRLSEYFSSANLLSMCTTTFVVVPKAAGSNPLPRSFKLCFVDLPTLLLFQCSEMVHQISPTFGSIQLLYTPSLIEICGSLRLIVLWAALVPDSVLVCYTVQQSKVLWFAAVSMAQHTG